MKKLQYSLFGLCTIIALFSCEKDENNLGANAGGNPDLVNANIVDTFQVVTYNQVEDSIISGEQNAPQLGAFNTAETGISSSVLYTSLVPDSFNFNFPTDSFAIDEFYISLDIVDVYGNNVNQEFEVYRIDELITDSVHYASNSIPYTDLMGTITVNQTDSATYDFDLDSAYAAQIMLADSQALSTAADFYDFFKGIAIVPKTSGLSTDEGAIYSLGRTGINLHLKYHTTYVNPPKDYDTEVTFKVERDDYVFTNSIHDFTGSELESVLNDSTLGNSYFYAQGLLGAIGKVSFPTMQDWYGDTNNYLINKFELTVYVEDNSSYPVADELMLTYQHSEGTTSFTLASYDATTSSYSFVISPSELDTQLKQKTAEDMDFTIMVPFPATNPNQVKIHGGGGINPPVLKIYYTEY